MVQSFWSVLPFGDIGSPTFGRKGTIIHHEFHGSFSREVTGRLATAELGENFDFDQWEEKFRGFVIFASTSSTEFCPACPSWRNQLSKYSRIQVKFPPYP